MTAPAPQPALARLESRIAAIETALEAMPDIIAARVIGNLTAALREAKING